MNFRPPRSQPEEHAGRDLGRDLGWLASVLWPGADVRLSPTGVPPGCRVAEAYAVLPSAARPRLLVPLSSIALGDPARQGFDGGRPSIASTTRAAAFRVAESWFGLPRAPELVVYFDREPRPGELLTTHLRGVFDRPDATLAISFGSADADRLPLIRILTLEGEVLGSGKVAWSETTRAFVATETAALRRWARERPRSFSVPDLLYEGGWLEHTVAVTSPIPTEPRSMRDRRPPGVDVTREIARSGGIALAPLGSTGWWRSIRERGSVAASAVVLGWMNELHGRRLLWHGSSHGEWVPEKMSTSGDVPHVWGWERSRDGVPLGLDPLHFWLRCSIRGPSSVRHASKRAIQRTAPALRALGVPRDDDPLLVACCIAELLVRPDGSGGTPAGRAMREALLADLRRWVARA